MKIKIIFLFIIIFFLKESVAFADFYKCTSKNGKVVFQNYPCFNESEERHDVLKSPELPSETNIKNKKPFEDKSIKKDKSKIIKQQISEWDWQTLIRKSDHTEDTYRQRYFPSCPINNPRCYRELKVGMRSFKRTLMYINIENTSSKEIKSIIVIYSVDSKDSILWGCSTGAVLLKKNTVDNFACLREKVEDSFLKKLNEEEVKKLEKEKLKFPKISKEQMLPNNFTTKKEGSSNIRFLIVPAEEVN